MHRWWVAAGLTRLDRGVCSCAGPVQVRLSDPSKLVYSPHVYGPAVYANMPYFRAANFPQNMPEIWDDHWARRGGAHPMVIGETGGHYLDSDRIFQDALVRFCVERGVGLL